MKIVNIDGENLHTSERLEEFQGNFREICDFIKSYKKAGLHPPSKRYIFGKTTGGIEFTPPPSLLRIKYFSTLP